VDIEDEIVCVDCGKVGIDIGEVETVEDIGVFVVVGGGVGVFVGEDGEQFLSKQKISTISK
jgi:dissimilatory sulfite reductase (desulfoviridin) alpha/beta subunit